MPAKQFGIDLDTFGRQNIIKLEAGRRAELGCASVVAWQPVAGAVRLTCPLRTTSRIILERGRVLCSRHAEGSVVIMIQVVADLGDASQQESETEVDLGFSY